MDDLTNEQKLLLTAMYRDYLELSKKVGPEKANAFGDNKANEISITDDTIIYFENKFKNNTSKVLNAINELLNFVPLFK